MSALNKLISIISRSQKRVGRGYGSGKGGHTATRGMKGQKSRSGGKVPLWFEGGQLPLIKRMPMLRGKGKLKPVQPGAEVSVQDINRMQAETITLDTLKLERIIKQRVRSAKIVGTGEVTRKVTVQGVSLTAGAKKAIEAAGGTIKDNKDSKE